MRAALIIVNLMLAVWLTAAVGSRVLSGGGEENLYSAKSSEGRKPVAEPRETNRGVQETPSLESRLGAIIDFNIFNPERTPNAFSNRNRNARVELTLLGTFEAGDYRGAIIRQRNAARNNNFMNMGNMGMWGPPGQGQPGPPGQQTGNNNQRNATRNRFGTNQNGQNDQNVTYKQYVRVGETLANGYTLTEVDRTRAVLVRGSDRMELELQEPSKNVTQSGTNANANQRRGNAMQQLQQMQQMQMMQNMQMMRMMQRSMQQNQNQNQNTGNRGGNTGNAGGARQGGGPGGGGPGR